MSTSSNRPIVALTGVAVLTGLLVFGIWAFQSGERNGPAIPGKEVADLMPKDALGEEEGSTGTEENPNARREFEWRRLYDPSLGAIPANMLEREMAFADRLPQKLAKTSTWTSRGPANVGGRSRALAYDVTGNGDVILAGGVSGGMWRTTDGGQSWTRTFDKSQRPSVTTVTQDTRTGKTSVWYAGSGEFIGNSAYGGANASYRGTGIYKSTDGGASWSLLPSTATGNVTAFDDVFDYVYRVRTDPSNATDDEVYAATYGAIVRSMDGGTNWNTVLNGLNGGQSQSTDLEVTSTGVVYATLSSESDGRGLYRSTDGTTWTDITPTGWPSDYRRTVVGVSPVDESLVWFLAYAPGSGPVGADGNGNVIDHILWRYDADASSGSRWTDFSDYLPTRGDNDDSVSGGVSGDFNSQGGYDLLVKPHPSDATKVFVGGRNLWRLDVSGSATDADTWIGGYTFTNDSFAAYEPNGSAEHHPDQHAVAFHTSDPDVMLVGSDGGIHRTDDNRATGDGGVTYADLNDGYITTQFYKVCLNQDVTDETIMGGLQDNGTWMTEVNATSLAWNSVLSGDGATCKVTNTADGSGRVWYVSSQNGNVIRAEFNSDYSQLQTSSSARPAGASGVLFIHPFEIDPADPTVMYYPGGTSMWRNASVETSPSSSWTELTGMAPPGYSITSLTGTDTGTLYYGATASRSSSNSSYVYRLNNAASATQTDIDGTSSPLSQSAPLPTEGYVSDIAVDPRDDATLLVAISNYGVSSLWYSEDGGQSWTDVEGNLGGTADAPSIRTVGILPQPGFSQTTYYAGTSVGLFSTTSMTNGTTWTQEGPNKIGNVVVDHLAIRTADGQVVAGTHGNGTYTSTVALPVELASFSATQEDDAVTLSWVTATETGNAGFRVEHQYASEAFKTVQFVQGNGTTETARRYQLTVPDLAAGDHVFRLRQIDTDGTEAIVGEHAMTVTLTTPYELGRPAPNPFRSTARLSLTVQETQRVRASLYNVVGQRVALLTDTELEANRPLDLTVDGQGLASGTYFVRVEGDGFRETRKVVLVK